ncbi:MAG: glycosyltransferase family 4 protein [Gammaproteobacteria bacterium]|nr:glycosyltransferase family 4 protein [Gammaproteobacteria bacterium]
MHVILSHSGKQHAYWLALALQQNSSLQRFYTSNYYKPDSWPDSLFAKHARVSQILQKRYQEGLCTSLVTRAPIFELPELIYRGVFGNNGITASLVEVRDIAFDAWISRKLKKNSAQVFWGFQGSCLRSLKAANSAGMLSVAEFATAHVDTAIRVLSEEAERHPEWADSIGNLKFFDWYRDRLREEPHHADYCVAASTYTRKSLEEVGITPESIINIPLGANLSRFHAQPRELNNTLRVLFVGCLSQRKGLKYLLQAVKAIKSHKLKLTLVGPRIGSGRGLDEYKGIFDEKGVLHGKALLDEYYSNDVLVLPSVFEGFGLVIIEAMATGIPVIGSTHTCAPDVIRDGCDGYVLEPDDVEGLVGKLEKLATNRSLVHELGMNASKRAQEYSWKQHAKRVALFLESIA